MNIANCLRRWLLRGAVVIHADHVIFDHCQFAVESGTGLHLTNGITTIYGDITATVGNGSATALLASDKTRIGFT